MPLCPETLNPQGRHFPPALPPRSCPQGHVLTLELSTHTQGGESEQDEGLEPPFSFLTACVQMPYPPTPDGGLKWVQTLSSS